MVSSCGIFIYKKRFRMKRCFYCNEMKDLSEYQVNNRKYQREADMGRCISCFDCEKKRAIKNMSTVRFNFETNKFELIYFNSINEIDKYYEKKEGRTEA